MGCCDGELLEGSVVGVLDGFEVGGLAVGLDEGKYEGFSDRSSEGTSVGV